MMLNPECPAPKEILGFFKRMSDALQFQYESILERIRQGNNLDQFQKDQPFYLLTTGELAEEFRKLRRELEQEVVLLLTASCEAALQIDRQRRVKRRLKDGVSRRFRKLSKEAKRKITKHIDVEMILDV